MEQPVFPAHIQSLLGGARAEKITEGLSRARVYRFCADREYFLKIEPRGGELSRERAALDWLRGRLPVPRLAAWAADETHEYLLTERAEGRALKCEYYAQNPLEAVSALADGLLRLRAVDTRDCPLCNDLDAKLRDARANVEAGADMSDWEPETDFASPRELLRWLIAHRPPEKRVFSHGDYCFENIFADGGQASGFIDLGRCGAADEWQDVALALRSLWHNFGTRRYDALLLQKIGVERDERKLKYYILLDELF